MMREFVGNKLDFFDYWYYFELKSCGDTMIIHLHWVKCIRDEYRFIGQIVKANSLVSVTS